MDLKKINDPDALVTPIAIALSKKLGKKELKFDKEHLSNAMRYALVSGEGGVMNNPFNVNHKEFVLPLFKSATDEIYWIGISIEFKKIQKKVHYYLFHVGLSVYQGQVTQQEKKKIFRAEWMIEDVKDTHAQPHWHVHNIGLKNINPFKSELTFDSNEAVQEFGSEQIEPAINDIVDQDDFKDFHFAMSSMWHKNASHVNQINSQKELIDWIEGCIDYIVHQLNYVYKAAAVAG